MRAVAAVGLLRHPNGSTVLRDEAPGRGWCGRKREHAPGRLDRRFGSLCRFGYRGHRGPGPIHRQAPAQFLVFQLGIWPGSGPGQVSAWLCNRLSPQRGGESIRPGAVPQGCTRGKTLTCEGSGLAAMFRSNTFVYQTHPCFSYHLLMGCRKTVVARPPARCTGGAVR